MLCDIIASKKLECCRDCDMLLCMCSILIPGLANLSQDLLLGKKSSSIDPEMPKKAIISVLKSYLSILEVLNVIFCIFGQTLSRKFVVIEEKCTKPYSLLSVFLQTDQMWSSGLHFCLLSSPVNDLPFPDSFYMLKKVDKGFPDTAVDYQWDAAGE